MGHVLRMSDERIVKKAVLGSWDMERTRSGNSRGNTIQYWRRLLKEAGHEDDNSENLTNDRKRWKKTVTDRRTFLKKLGDANVQLAQRIGKTGPLTME